MGQMPETFASRSKVSLIRSPSPRQQATRRRRLALGGVLALALASGLVGAMSDHHAETLGQPQTGPFSYIASE